MSYDNTLCSYQVTTLNPASTSLVPDRTQEISYNSLDRPSVLTEGYKTATFTYNAAGDRVKMQESNSGYTVLTRYYIGGQYEYDSTPAGIKERLYLGGDAYSAPMVLQRTNGGSWTAYNIGRDYLGSITHIATSSGTLVAEYSYDPWGRLRNPATQAIYTPGTEPALFLGRGYTGHEHLTWFGLINMNARLYDPLLGRFLSPDPYVQAPDFTQNFNRYSYALNNPLRYTDTSGNFVITAAMTVGIALGCFFGSMAGSYIGFQHGATGMDMIGYIVGGAAIGGLASFAGGAIGSALGSIANSGFLGGALASGSSAAASCFVSGTGFSLLNGDTFPQALRNGLISSGIGFAAGGIMRGLSSGISSVIHGGNFWTGKGAIEEYTMKYMLGDNTICIGEGMEYSTEYAQSFSERNFGSPKNVNQLFANGQFPKGKGYYYDGDYVLNKNGEVVLGLTKHNGLGRGSDIYLFKAAFRSKEQLYLTMGHEFLHAAFYSPGIDLQQHYYDTHAVIYDWSLKQALAWSKSSVDLHHYFDMYNQFSIWLKFNPYSYQEAGFGIIYHLPL